MKGIPWTVGEIDKLKELADSELTNTEIAKKLGRPAGSISGKLLTLRGGRTGSGRHQWTAVDDEAIVRLRREGKKFKEIGAAIGRHPAAVHKRLQALGHEDLLSSSRMLHAPRALPKARAEIRPNAVAWASKERLMAGR